MASTWKKVIAGFAFAAVVGSQVGVAVAGKSCGRRRLPAAPVVAPAVVAPVTVAPVTPASVTPAPVAPAPVAPVAVAPIAAGAKEPAAAAGIDLEINDIRLVDNGNDEQGPSYRLTVKNLGQTSVTSEITVALLASLEKDSEENLSVLGSLESLEAGATKSVDLRLPKGAEVRTYLTAAAAPADVDEPNATDNVAIVERDAVAAIR